MAYQPPNQYGAPQYGAPPPQSHSPQPPYGQQPYGAPPPQPYGAPPAPYGQPPPGQYQQQPYGQPPPPQQYGAPQPYGQPPPGQYQQPYGQQPPPQPYGQPPPGQYQQPPYGQPPPPQPYGSQPAYGQPPPGQYGSPAPNQGYGAPPAGYPAQGGYGQPPQQQYPPAPPSMGYGAPQIIAWDGGPDADGCRKAMKGFGTDEKALIRHLADKDPLQIAAIVQAYHSRHKRHLLVDVESEVSGKFEDVLTAIVRGPLKEDVYQLRKATDGPGTKEKVLNDVLLGRSNADLRAIKDEYKRTYHSSLESDIKSELSMKTERLFLMVLAANRNEESAPVIQQQIDADVMEIYKATEGRSGTDELLVCNLLSQRSDGQIRAIALTYKQKFSRDLETVIKKEFSGHMEDALIYQLRTGTDKAMRDAILLEESMSGIGTTDHLLINRVVKLHWDKNHMQQVKGAYQHRFGRSLTSRIRGETSGDYEKALCGCLGEF